MSDLQKSDLSVEQMGAAEEAHSLRDLSETVLGLVAEGLISPQVIDPNWFAQPYDRGAKEMCKTGAAKEDLAKVLPSDVLNTMHNKVAHMNGAGAMYDWVDMLHRAYNSFRLGDRLERAAYALKKNAPTDLAPIHQHLSEYLTHGMTGIRTAAEIDYHKYEPFQDSGIDYIDRIIGGWPTDGPIVVFGDTGVGKSFFGAKMLIEYLLHHQHKTGAVYSFEMSEEHWMSRTYKMFPTIEKVRSRLYVSGSVDKPNDLVPEVMTHNFDFIVVDDMDNMFEGEANPGKYEASFKVIKRIARLKKIPVVALSQAKQRGEGQMGRFLGKYDAAWSAANERSAALLIALQNAGTLDRNWKGDDTYPIEDEAMQYLIFLKSRDDWPKQRGPGAIILKMDMDTANQYKSRIWSGELYKGESRLWQPKRRG